MTNPNSELKVNIQNILFKRFRIQDGNPQYADALLASTDIAALIANAAREARREENKRKLSLHIDQFSSADYKAGFTEALDQIDAATKVRLAVLDSGEGEE